MSALIMRRNERDADVEPQLAPPPNGYAYVRVDDNLNAPKFEIGDILQVDMRVTTFAWDGIYVIRLGDRDLVRHVQHMPRPEGGMGYYVFSSNVRHLGFYLSSEELRVLGAVVTVCSFRRVA